MFDHFTFSGFLGLFRSSVTFSQGLVKCPTMTSFVSAAAINFGHTFEFSNFQTKIGQEFSSGFQATGKHDFLTEIFVENIFFDKIFDRFPLPLVSGSLKNTNFVSFSHSVSNLKVE